MFVPIVASLYLASLVSLVAANDIVPPSTPPSADGNCVSGRYMLNDGGQFYSVSGTLPSSFDPDTYPFLIMESSMLAINTFGTSLFTSSGSPNSNLAFSRWLHYAKITINTTLSTAPGVVSGISLTSTNASGYHIETIGTRNYEITSYQDGKAAEIIAAGPDSVLDGTFSTYVLDWTDSYLSYTLNGYNGVNISRESADIFPTDAMMLSFGLWTPSDPYLAAADYSSNPSPNATIGWIEIQCYDDNMKPVDEYPTTTATSSYVTVTEQVTTVSVSVVTVTEILDTSKAPASTTHSSYKSYATSSAPKSSTVAHKTSTTSSSKATTTSSSSKSTTATTSSSSKSTTANAWSSSKSTTATTSPKSTTSTSYTKSTSTIRSWQTSSSQWTVRTTSSLSTSQTSSTSTTSSSSTSTTSTSSSTTSTSSGTSTASLSSSKLTPTGPTTTITRLSTTLLTLTITTPDSVDATSTTDSVETTTIDVASATETSTEAFTEPAVTVVETLEASTTEITIQDSTTETSTAATVVVTSTSNVVTISLDAYMAASSSSSAYSTTTATATPDAVPPSVNDSDTGYSTTVSNYRSTSTSSAQVSQSGVAPLPGIESAAIRTTPLLYFGSSALAFVVAAMFV